MKKKSGFTLIEVLAVIIIIGVLAIIAVPAVTKYISRSNDSVYASDAFAFTENVRSKYEMGEYGDYLKDNEIMIVPIRTVVLEKGNEEESPYGAYEFEKSYVIIVPEDNQYKFYVNIIDETNTGIINVPANSLDKSSVMQDIQAEIPTVSSFEITGTIYRLNGKEYKKIETREIIGDDVHDEDSAKAYVFKDITMDDNPSIVYNITLNNKGATVAGTSNIYELYSVGWYSDSSATTRIQTITPPTRNGYAFGGYYTQDNGGGKQVINAVGYINANTTSTFTSDGTLYAKWTECGKGYYSQNSLTCSICPEGYRDGTDVSTKTSEGACIKSVPAGKFVGSSGAVNVSTCATNTYSNPHTVKYGATSSCPACTSLGSGYTKSAGGTGESGCYMTVTAGKYVKNEKDPTATKCSANSYSGDHTVYYGNKSICSLCINLGTNYKKSAEGSSETGCYMEVPAGKYKTEAKGNSWTNCSANNYSIKHNSYYGSADNSCTGCPSGYSSVAGSQSKAACTITCSANTRVTAADGKCTGTCSGNQISQHTVNASNTSPACTACTNGTGVATWGTGCTVNTCKANYYKNGNACTACAGGTTTSAGNTASSCSACTNGTGVNAWGSGCTVNTCKANYYKNGNGCTACPSGYSSGAGSTSKSACKITCGANTRVGTADGKCTTTCSGTSIGQHTVSAGSTSPGCSACSNGTGVATWGTGCTVNSCKANYYKNGNGCTYCANGVNAAGNGCKTEAVITCTNPGYTGGDLTIATCSGGSISNQVKRLVGSYTVSCISEGREHLCIAD